MSDNIVQQPQLTKAEVAIAAGRAAAKVAEEARPKTNIDIVNDNMLLVLQKHEFDTSTSNGKIWVSIPSKEKFFLAAAKLAKLNLPNWPKNAELKWNQKSTADYC